MRGAPTFAAAAAAAAVLLAACHPAPLGHARGGADRSVAVAAALDCPDRQGDFALGRRAADGASCSYAAPDGAQLHLTRVALLGGSATRTLAGLDAQAYALAPAAPGRAGAGAAPSPPSPPPPPDEGGDHVRLDLPGLHLDADGEHAHVSGFGQRVEAGEGGAVVQSGAGASRHAVIADDGGATIRDGGVGAHSVDADLILASKTAGPGGWRSAGYVVRGPLDGPLVVAQVQARGGDKDGEHGDPFRAARALVDLNIRR